MRARIMSVVLLGGLLSCQSTDPTGTEPPLPRWNDITKLRALRQNPDFTFRDHARRKQYYLRLYEEPGFREQIVTVLQLDHSGNGERPADPEEFRYAIGVFEDEWLRKSEDERLQFHRRLREIEQRRTATHIDTELRLKREALRKTREKKEWEIDVQIRARKEVPDGPDVDRLPFLEKESESLRFDILVLEAQLKILEYKRWLIDQSSKP